MVLALQPGNFWTSLVFGVVPALVLLAAVWWLDRYEKEPARLLGLGLIFGAVVAPVVAWAIEQGLDITTSFSSQVIVPESQLGVGTPLVEELVRGTAILIVFLLVRFEIDDILDGIIYGGIVGIGFGAAANFVSIYNTQPIGDVNAAFYPSVITALNHVFYGALIGLAIALFRRGRREVLALAALGGTALAFGFHVLHDYLPHIGASSASDLDSNFGREVLTQAPNYFGVFILGVIALWAAGRQHLIVARELRDEIGTAITREEYDAVTNSFRRSWILWTDLLWQGERVWRLRRTLYATIIELAFRKYHRGDREESQSRFFADEDTYRQQIRDLRADLVRLYPAAAEGLQKGEPKPPRNTIVAGLGGLTTFGLIVGVAVLIWVLGLRPEPTHTGPQLDTDSFGQIVGGVSGGGGSAPSTATPPVQGAAQSGGMVNVLLCRQFRTGRCVGLVADKGRMPRRLSSLVVLVTWSGLKARDTLTLGFFNADTRQPVVDEAELTLNRARGFFPITFDGPFPRLKLLIAVLYNGARVSKDWNFRLV
jgi:RsiW-degrading membrane proteinase PrsW (M82 family)